MGYSDDGRWIVTTGADGTLKVWDATYHSLVRTIELDDGPATSLALYGARALTGHGNGKVVLWDLDRAEKVANVQRNDANIWAVAFTGDPNRFATASHDWKVTLWDARQAAAPLQVLDGHENSVQTLAYSPQALLLASGSADKTIRLWNLDTLSLKRSYSGPRDSVTATAFSHNGKLLAGGALYGRISVWSIQSSRRHRSLNGHSAVLGFADGTLLAWAGGRNRAPLGSFSRAYPASADWACRGRHRGRLRARRAASGFGRRERPSAPVGATARSARQGLSRIG
jgi:WD40 repeat protein